VTGRAIVAALLEELLALPDEQLAPLAARLAPLVDGARPAEAAPSPFLTADEAAELLRCRKRRVYELVGDGRLLRHGEGRRLLLRRADVLALASGDARGALTRR
jgi:excisionase family DNA binding protein